MAGNYSETSVTGAQWKRAKVVHIYNNYGGTGQIMIEEEQLTALEGDVLTKATGVLSAAFDPEGTFPEINPETGEPTGGTVSHMGLYVALHSLYIHLASERDKEEVD